MRLATGTGETYVTTNQTLGTYGARYQIAVDQGFIRWTGGSSTGRQILTATARDLGPKGFDPQFGAGLVDAYAAIRAIEPVIATTGAAAGSAESR